MTIDVYYDYCLAKKGVTEHFPFDEDTLVFKVGGKMFALSSLQEWENGTPSVNLKCDPDWALELRGQYDDIQAGYHMSKVHWNTVKINGSVSDGFIKELIDHSYDLVFKTLTKKTQKEVEEGDNFNNNTYDS
ncbi:MAG TPA: MmcQ/YjbR family DNA-binding protein [Flavobacterium sp.]|uniref:MmcQ/YjbR family DNA-binding protein n=1 Tax=Flavobacterium sp. TaxID=239 RepID=UPI002B70801B|nr:MmcQ/YjbR family DNA-binding protein [Flavobacterium sp.]HSD14601.1 MmcQ/YjbR family DNA-binding protein [Flavobacterium sp.]